MTVSERENQLQGLFSRRALFVLVGYCLCRAVTFHSYTTDFALLNGAYGFISNLPFVIGSSVSLVATSLIVLVLALKRKLPAFSLSFRVPLLILALGYLVALFLHNPSVEVLVGLGLAWGVATALLTIGWMEMFAAEDSPMVLVLQLTAAMLVSALIASVARAFVPEGSVLFCLAMLVTCYAIMVVCRRMFADESGVDSAAETTSPLPASDDAPEAGVAGTSFASSLKEASTLLLAWCFFELIVGLVNMYAFCGPQSAFSIAESAPLSGMLICAGIIIAFVYVTNKAPNPTVIFLFVFPFVIGIFMLLPFFGEQFGGLISMVIYVAYASTSMLANFWYLRVAHRSRRHALALAAFATGSVRIMLMVGLALGWWFSGLSEGESFVHLSIIAVVCVYCLMLVLVLWGFANAKAKQRTVVVTESFEEARRRRVDELARKHDLTPREVEVLAQLAQGKTARSMADALCISTSTVQGHIKSIYAKLGVNKKQQVLDLFDPARFNDESKVDSLQ